MGTCCTALRRCCGGEAPRGTSEPAFREAQLHVRAAQPRARSWVLRDATPEEASLKERTLARYFDPEPEEELDADAV